ncbi:MAG: hypothetical protein U0821_09695 [Chloroflexota bacterium]
MSRIVRDAGRTEYRGDAYRVTLLDGNAGVVRVTDHDGGPIADLLLMSSAHPAGRTDAVTSLSHVEALATADGHLCLHQRAQSTVWQSKHAELRCQPDRIEYRFAVNGGGAIDTVAYFERGAHEPRYSDRHTLSGFHRPPRARDGWRGSTGYFQNVVSPAPNGACRSLFGRSDTATNHPGNDAGFWGGDWFFTPAPYAYGLVGRGSVMIAGLAPSLDELDFYRFDYRGGAEWGLALTYDGAITARGDWQAPTVLLLPAADADRGLRAYAASIQSAGLLPPKPSGGPDWWTEPNWCGWGEQVAQEGELRAFQLSSAANYREWLSRLDAHGVVPGTVVVDDRWQSALGEGTPSAAWADLGVFIAERHQRGQRVLLWHNVWEIERPSPGERTIERGGEPLRGAFGHLLADPTSDWFHRRITDVMRRMLAPPPVGLGADGLKLDITHSTPTADGLWTEGTVRGNALLRALLLQTYQAAKAANPDAVVESHAANPYFRDTFDVLRLNDIFTDLASVVDEMTRRTATARAMGFDLIDCDGWSMPSKAALLEYVEAQETLGTPSLYYATRVDSTREPIEPDDLRRVAASWSRYRRVRG